MSMSSLEDPKRQLEVIIAYLRLGLRDGGIPLKIKGGYDLTPQLQNLVGRGDMSILRSSRSTNRLVHRIFTSPQGIERLADYDRRYGEELGAGHVIPVLKADQPRR